MIAILKIVRPSSRGSAVVPQQRVGSFGSFVDWDDIENGNQRVHACRTTDGRLLQVGLEDLNPYPSLGLLDTSTRDSSVETMKASGPTQAGR